MKVRSVYPMKIAKYGYIFISIVFCIAGLILILFPTLSASVIGIFFGITMLVFGVIKLIGYFSKDLFRLAFQYDLQFGILLCILGVITLVKHQDVVRFICIAYGISMIADCLFKVKTAFEAKHFGIHQWWLTLVLAIMAGIAGLLITLLPTVTMRVISILLGISLLTEGVLGLSVAISMVKIIDHQQPDIVDVDDYEVWEET